jgi:hypothetical protein
VPGRVYGLGITVTGEVKALLESAADASGRTQSQEAAARIEAGFDREQRLGGRQAIALFEALGAAGVSRFGTDWASNAAAFYEMTEGELGREIMKRLRPVWSGEEVPLIARPVSEPAAHQPSIDVTRQRSDVPAQHAGSALHEHELIEQLLRALDQTNRLLAQMLVRVESTAQQQSPGAAEARPEA